MKIGFNVISRRGSYYQHVCADVDCLIGLWIESGERSGSELSHLHHRVECCCPFRRMALVEPPLIHMLYKR